MTQLDKPMVVFTDRLNALIQKYPKPYVLRISPRMVAMPLPMKRHDDPYFPFGRMIVEATHDVVCGYLFDLAAYMVQGAAGMIALERTINYASGDSLTILDGRFASSEFHVVMDENAFNVESVTLADDSYLNHYQKREDRGAFVVYQTVFSAVNHGAYWLGDGLLTYPKDDNLLKLQVLGDEVLYAGHGEDFGQVARSAIEQLNGDTSA